MIEQPRATKCRCGVALDLCSDCRDWLVVNSPRIVSFWRSWLDAWDGDRSDKYKALLVKTHAPTDVAEIADRAYFLSRSWFYGD